MPVTLHCGLEAAGILGSGADACCDETEACSDDICADVEDSNYTSFGKQLRVSTPALLACSNISCLPQVTVRPPEEAAWTESMDASLNWLSDWQFVRRTAFPARAPSLNA